MHIPRMLLVYAATMLGFVALLPAHASGYSAIPASKTLKRDVCGFDYGPVHQELVTSQTQQGRFMMEPDAFSIARLLTSGVLRKGISQNYAPAVLNVSIAPLE